MLAIAYKANGQITKAVKLLEYIVEGKKALPENHPSRLASQHNPASAYMANGQITKAVKLLEHVVEVRKALPENHPDRRVSEHALAIVYKAIDLGGGGAARAARARGRGPEGTAGELFFSKQDS